ncbi:MAG: HEPN domain-containing protein, partial [Steroidobacteraceae bacterium]
MVDTLVRKSRRALRSARLDLNDGDTDGAVNRSYYAMVNTAQAALLSSGVAEDKLPRTHSGLIAAFGEQAVKPGKVDPEFGRLISKTESLRLRADYVGVELDLATAEKALAGAERFVQSVERAFGLQSMSTEAAPGGEPPANQRGANQEVDDSLWDKSEGMVNVFPSLKGEDFQNQEANVLARKHPCTLTQRTLAVETTVPLH